jgi:hypothetical protein
VVVNGCEHGVSTLAEMLADRSSGCHDAGQDVSPVTAERSDVKHEVTLIGSFRRRIGLETHLAHARDRLCGEQPSFVRMETSQ